ncbi:MAG TPA: hypothetical protein VGG70_11530, partial [Candidatus Cybelea sp.]
MLAQIALIVAAATALPSPATIDAVVRKSMAANHLRAVIVEVRSDGSDVYKDAIGDSMTGVPATADM